MAANGDCAPVRRVVVLATLTASTLGNIAYANAPAPAPSRLPGVDIPVPRFQCFAGDVIVRDDEGSPSCVGTDSLIGNAGNGYGTSSIPENEAIRAQDPMTGKPSVASKECAGNPVILATGNKVETHLDFQARGELPLKLERHWNDFSGSVGLFGAKTSSLMDQRLVVEASDGSTLRVWTKDGDNIVFKGSAAANRWTAGTYSATSVEFISKNAQGQWVYMLSNGASVTFAPNGSVLQIKNTEGVSWRFEYGNPNALVTATSPNTTLQRVVHAGGKSMSFAYTTVAGRAVVAQVIDPAGRVYRYAYQANADGRVYLSSVKYPSASDESLGSMREHEIRYEINALGQYTGKFINGVRYSTFAYDAGGRAILSAHTSGAQSFSFAYGAMQTTVTNPLGQRTTYSFDAANNVVRTDGAAGLYCGAIMTLTASNPSERTTTVTDANGYVTRAKTDADGNLIEEIKGFGSSSPIVTNYEWNAFPRRVTKVTTAQLQTVLVWGSNNRLQRLVQTDLTPAGAGRTRTTSYTYVDTDGNGLPEQSTVDGVLPGTADTITTSYSPSGDILQVNRMGKVTSYGGHNGMGAPSHITDANNVLTLLTLDGRDNATTISQAGRVMRVAYTALGEVAQMQAPDGTVTTSVRDTAQRVTGVRQRDTYRAALLGIQDAEFGLNFVLNANDDILSATYWGHGIAAPTGGSGSTSTPSNPPPPIRPPTEPPLGCAPPRCQLRSAPLANDVPPKMRAAANVAPTNGVTHWWEYDEYGRQREARGNNGQKLTYRRSSGGRLTSVIDATGLVNAVYTYDEHGRIATSKDGAGATTSYAYDSEGRLIRVTDPRGLITSYVFDGFGNLFQVNSPDTGVTTFAYNAAGQRVGESRADGTTLAMAYLGDGRLQSISATRGGNTQTRTYTYDNCANGIGRICSITESSGESMAYTYTAQGAVQTQVNNIAGQSFTTRWDYNSAGQISALTYPNGHQLSYGWQDGLVRTVQMNTGSGWVTVVNRTLYQPHGAIESFTDLTGGTRFRTYDRDGRLTATNGLAGAQSFTYNTRDLLTGITGADIQSATYDNAGRLTYVAQTDLNSSFTYDADGNRLTASHNGLSNASYIHSSTSNRLTSINSPSGSRSMLYNAAGSLVQDQRGGVTDCHGYDSFGRLVQFDRFNASIACTGSSAGAASSGHYRFNALNQRTFKHANGVSTRFVYGQGGELLYEVSSTGLARSYAWFGGELVAAGQGAQVLSVYSDHLGRPSKILDGSGNTKWDAKNWAFDRQIRSDAIGGLNIGYPGQYWDSESGLWQNWHRTYDGSIGRYVQSDPIGLQGGINTYSYVGGNPVSYVDANGLCPCGDLTDLLQLARGDRRDWSKAADRRDVHKAFKSGTNKCNLFVDEQYENAGYHLPNLGGMPWSKGTYPPGAQSLSVSGYSVPGWPEVKGPAQPGDLVAYLGHVGIVTGSGTTISASPSGKVENDWGFRPGQGGVVIRRCTCGG